MRPGLFRPEALDRYVGQRFEGDILRYDLRWLRWTYRIVAVAMLCAVAFVAVFDVNEYASGVALIRIDGRRSLATSYAGIVEEVIVQPGEHVTKGQALVALSAPQEESELGRATAEFNLHLAQLLHDPADSSAKQALASLRPRRDQARELARARVIRAPLDGVITDVRVRPGQQLEAHTNVVGIAPVDSEVTIVCVLPGDYRPMLKAGQDIRFTLDGYKFEYSVTQIEMVGEEVIGPLEIKRYLGPEVAEALPIQGPSVLVKGRLSSRTFEADGQSYRYVEGLTARVDVAVRRQSILFMLLPALKVLRRG